jgi:MFS family permease
LSAYLDELTRELTRAGVRGRSRERIVAEFADHLDCDPSAELGSPTALARQFADELGTDRARRGAAAAFAALAVAGAPFAIAVLGSRYLGGATGARSPLLGTLASVVGVLAPQFAFAAGMLAILRALRHRRDAVVSRAEANVILRRAAIALVAGVATMAALALMAIEFPHTGSSGWRTFSLVAAALGAAGLIAATPAVLRAIKLRPAVAGAAGDIFDDLGPLAPAGWRGHPWRPALAIAALVGVAVALAGVVGSDPYDGVARGMLDAGACLAGFALLGRYVGLRPARA